MEPRDHVPPALSRRALLRSGTAAAALGVAWPLQGRSHEAPATPATRAAARGSAKNLIFLVSDGMAAGTLTLADLLTRHTSGKPGHWWRLLNQPGARRALVSTHAADSLVTDSAAASAAWSTGEKHHNGALCIAPDGTPLRPLLIRAAASGRRVGVCTTTTITHATPAGFYANCPKRDLQADIGRILLDSPVDLALGGGRAYVPADLTAPRAGLRHLHTRADLLAQRGPLPSGHRLIGTFDPDHLRMVLDRPAEQPSLEDLAAAALNALGTSPDGFVLQIEAGRVDHAAHDNDACALAADQLEFDRTLALVAEFALARSDTLLIATADHATANPGLTLYGRRGAQGLTRLSEGRRSFEWMFGRARAGALADLPPPTADGPAPQPPVAALASGLAGLVGTHLGITLGPTRTRTLERALAKEQTDPFAERAIPTAVLGSLLADDLGVAFISPHHSADHVELLALGAGADTFPAALDNTQVHHHLCSLLGLPPAR